MDTDCGACRCRLPVPRGAELRSWRRWVPCGACQRQLRRKLVALHGGVRTRACAQVDPDSCALGDRHGMPEYCSELCSGRRRMPSGAGECELRGELVGLHGGLRERPCPDVDADGCAVGDWVCVPHCGA